MKTAIFLATILFNLSSCLAPNEATNKAEIVHGMAKSIRLQFSEIKHISIEDYNKDKDQYQLVDVRSSQEQNVSMIPGAITQAQYEKNPSNFSQKTILAYCTIGQRSSEYAVKLSQKGISAANLQESILGWTHRQLELIHNGAPSKKVHVWSEAWNFVADGYEGIYDK